MLSGWQKLTDKKQDALAVSFITALIVAVFWKTVFLAEPISRIFLLAKRDVLFRKYFTLGASGFDESVFLLLMPYYHLVANYWRSFQLPLWNPYTGWGVPLLGDIQAAVFSPLRILFAINPSLHFYNILLVFELMIAAAGCYLFAREIKLPRYVAAYVALGYAFCPYNMYYLELLSGTSSALYPLIFWNFARLANKPSITRALLSAASCAIFIGTGHPESSFIGITFATLFSLLIFAFTQKKGSKFKNTVTGFKWIAVVAGLALCFAAPVILPFCEFFSHADCYKFATDKNAVAPWQALVLNLVQANYLGASPYTGVFGVPFLLLAFFARKNSLYYLPVAISGILAFLFVSRPGFLNDVLNLSPLTYVPGTYCIPIFILFILIGSGFGFAYLVETFAFQKNKFTLLFVVALLVTCFLPPALELLHYDFKSGSFDNGVAPMAFAPRLWFVTVGLALALTIFIFFKQKIATPILIAFILAASFVSQAQIGRLSLPIQSKFNFDYEEPLPFLHDRKERALAVGFDVLSPNTNLVFQIPSVGSHNVMTPSRYKAFMKELGAKRNTFNTLVDRTPLSPMIDFAGVKYILSLAPVSGVGDPNLPEQACEMGSEPIHFESTEQLTLERASLGYDIGKAETAGTIKFGVAADSRKRFVFSVVMLDQAGNTLWYGGLIGCCPTGKKVVNFEVPVGMPGLVPLTLKAGDKFTVGIQVFDSEKMKFIKPVSGSGLKMSEHIICLKDFVFASPDTKSVNSHYRLVSESGRQHVRVYENTRTLGRAYLMFNSVFARDESVALNMVSADGFDGLTTVVLESGKKQQELSPLVSVERGKAVTLGVNEPNCIEMDVDSPADAMLVLTDTFFPGWSARVDGKDTEIVLANYLFRAVAVPKGIHHVAFTYQPNSFLISLLLWILGVITAGILLVKNRVRK
ncbi:MAG: YfhO family protein [Leptolyngbya sp.]|nr:YfhO family protein [Candidatus Melainabacteria bacterium]